MKIAMIRKAGAIKRILRRCRLRRLLPWVWAVVTICSGCTRFVSTCIFQLLRLVKGHGQRPGTHKGHQYTARCTGAPCGCQGGPGLATCARYVPCSTLLAPAMLATSWEKVLIASEGD